MLEKFPVLGLRPQMDNYSLVIYLCYHLLVSMAAVVVAVGQLSVPKLVDGSLQFSVSALH